MARVFLSHAKLDMPVVRRIAEALRAAGHNPWLDDDEILVGESIPKAVERGLREADFVVICLSEAAAGRGWIEAERDATLMQQFDEWKERILPVRLEEVTPPHLIAPIAYVDLFPDEHAFTNGIGRLTRSIDALEVRHASRGDASDVGAAPAQTAAETDSGVFTASALASKVLETIFTSVVSAGIDKTRAGAATHNKRARSLERYLDEITKQVTYFVTYRPAPQHIDDAYVEPTVLDGALSRTFLAPFDLATIAPHMKAALDEIQATLSGAAFSDSTIDAKAKILSGELGRQLQQKIAVTGTVKLSISTLIHSKDGILILGEAGSGKSALICHLCWQRLHFPAPRLPLHLTSRMLRSLSIEQHLQSTLDSLFLGDTDPRDLDRSLAIYIDGLDELPRDRYREVCLELADLRKRLPSCWMVCACRAAAYNGELGFLCEVSIAPFGEQQATSFVERWFEATRNGPTASDFLEAVHRNNRVAELTSQPLLLSLMCNAFRRYLDFSRRQSTLFEQCVGALLWQWDAERVIKRDSSFVDLDLSKRLWLHAALAFYFHENGVRFVRRRELVEILRQVLPRFGLDNSNEEMLRELCSHHGLLVQWSGDAYGFGHLALQEFLAAKWLSDERRWMKLLDLSLLANPWWRNVIGLTAGTLSDGTEMLTRILGIDLLTDIERHAIAAHCLKYDPIVDPDVREQIVRQVLTWYHDGDASHHNAAAWMLAGIEDGRTAQRIQRSLASGLLTSENVHKHLR